MREGIHPHKYDHFDVVRGISAYAVLIAHIHQVLFWRILGSDSAAAICMAILARHAVLVFFLLSGFLITRSIRSNITRFGVFDITDYLAARVARIYPPLMGALVVCALVGVVIHGLHLPGDTTFGTPGDLYRVRDRYAFRPVDMASALVMRGGILDVNASLWTLFIEVQLYIAAMGIAAWSGPRRPILALWSSIGFLALTLAMIQPLFAAVWGMGALFELVPMSRSPAVRWATILGISLAALAIVSPELFGRDMDRIRGDLVQAACCIVYSVVLFVRPPRLRYPRWLIHTGDFSYSLYVVHFPLLLLALSLTQDWAGHSLPRTTLAAACAAVAITAITLPFARVLERQHVYKGMLLRAVSAVPSL